MTSLNLIQKFLQSPKMAIAGASRDSRKFGGAVFNELKSKGIELYPVHPDAEKIQGVKCYRSVFDLPEDIRVLYIVTPRDATTVVAEQAAERGFDMVWIQRKCETEEAVEILRKKGVKLIFGKCLMMFADPVKGVHGFHRFLSKAFGNYPKMVAPSAN